MMLRLQPAFVSALTLTVTMACAACDPAPAAREPAAAAATEVQDSPAPAPSPVIDRAAAERFAHDGGALEIPELPASGALILKGAVKGDTAPAYAFALAAGQTLTVAFAPSNASLYFNLSDAADTSGAALHRGEVDGAEATVVATRDMTVVVTPFQPRAMARRGETGDYALTVTRR